MFLVDLFISGVFGVSYDVYGTKKLFHARTGGAKWKYLKANSQSKQDNRT